MLIKGKSILVTGASGFLGSRIIGLLNKKNIAYHTFKHKDPIENINWEEITHIINCASVTPNDHNMPEDYYEGNVLFLNKMLPFLKDKHLLHFSSISVFFRYEAYQISKMISDSILFHNKNYFSALDILPLPTLEDETIINHIVDQIQNNNQTIVDRLIYNFCEPEVVAEVVVNYIVNNKELKLIYTKKNLFEEVSKLIRVNINPGTYIDRTCLTNNLFTTAIEAQNSFIKLFKK